MPPVDAGISRPDQKAVKKAVYRRLHMLWSIPFDHTGAVAL
jgi:hypothetical protein